MTDSQRCLMKSVNYVLIGCLTTFCAIQTIMLILHLVKPTEYIYPLIVLCVHCHRLVYLCTVNIKPYSIIKTEESNVYNLAKPS